MRIVPFPGALKVLSCEPYSSAACAIRPTLGTLPIVFGSRAPCFLQNSIDLMIDRRIAGVGNHAFGVLQPCLPDSTSCPLSRMTGGMEASMMMSLGTCRLVIPLSEFTIAIGGRFL